MQKILATRQRVVKIFVLLKSNALFNAFLREEGGTRQRFPEANEMSFGGSLRSVTEGACATLTFSLALLQLLFPSYALSLSRLRRQLPPGGSLSQNTSCLYPLFASPHRQ